MARRARRKSQENGEYAGDDGAAGAGHNSEKSSIIKDPAERAALIESTVREVALLESERKELGERIRALKSANIKGRLGLKIGDFNAAFRVFNLEDDGRTAFLKTLRETFDALGVGEQLDFLAVPGAVPTGEEMSLG